MTPRPPPLTRPEGPEAGDFALSRRGLAGLMFGGYAVAALSAEAAPITTDAEGLVAGPTTLPTANSRMPAYVARPDRRGRSPVVLVVSEVFGLHAYIRDLCRRLAKGGYYAIAPDFFHRAGDPAPLTDFAEIGKIVATATNEQVMGDVAATLAWVRRQAEADSRRAAITGFCWGGSVVWMAAARFDAFRAGAVWYGRLVKPAPGERSADERRPWPIDVAGSLKAPVLGLYAENDRGIPLASVEAMRAALRGSGRRDSTILVYPGAQHGFHADYRDSYSRAAAEDGWRRMLDHFRRHGLGARAIEAEARRGAGARAA